MLFLFNIQPVSIRIYTLFLFIRLLTELERLKDFLHPDRLSLSVVEMVWLASDSDSHQSLPIDPCNKYNENYSWFFLIRIQTKLFLQNSIVFQFVVEVFEKFVDKVLK